MASNSTLKVGDGLRSCTASVNLSVPFTVDGVPITLIDTPGFDDTLVSDTDILRMIAVFLASTYEAGSKLSGVIYMHRISDARLGGTSRKNFNIFRKLCGDKTLKNVIVATNMWNTISKDLGEKRERELMTDDILFKPVIDQGAQMARHNGTRQSAFDILRMIIKNHPEALRIQEELITEEKDITQTEACRELDKDRAAVKKRQREELEELKQQLEEARVAKDMETVDEVKKEEEHLQKQLAEIETKRAQLSKDYAEERRKVREEMEWLNSVLQTHANLSPTGAVAGLDDTLAKGATQQSSEERPVTDPEYRTKSDIPSSSRSRVTSSPMPVCMPSPATQKVANTQTTTISKPQASVTNTAQCIPNAGTGREQNDEGRKGGHAKHQLKDAEQSSSQSGKNADGKLHGRKGEEGRDTNHPTPPKLQIPNASKLVISPQSAVRKMVTTPKEIKRSLSETSTNPRDVDEISFTVNENMLSEVSKASMPLHAHIKLRENMFDAINLLYEEFEEKKNGLSKVADSSWEGKWQLRREWREALRSLEKQYEEIAQEFKALLASI
ncbi:hypothetical protein C8Q75DRAFT_763351 [Abortiporus biennis]|nr:hypothetical protein C8Q75DRAFT_763351 [Abortiporus biennis]